MSFSQHRGFQETFLSTLEIPLGEYSDDESQVVEEKLAPFECPPPPRLTRKHHYYSLTKSDRTSRQAMTDWEKKAILSRFHRHADLNIENFQRRLSNVAIRNTDRYVAFVRQRAETEREAVAQCAEDQLRIESARRNRIFFRHKNMVYLNRLDKFITRAKAWYEIIVFHVFLTALMQERRVQEALETFSFLMSPMVKRFVAIKRKREAAAALTRERMNDIPFPSPQVIQSMYGTFFSGWPSLLLEKLVAKATPMYLKQGSYLMHEGDLGRVMFMITKGTVSIILRKKGGSKCRTKENSSGVFCIHAPCYVGEFALVCKEPRSASIYCETDIGYWAVLPEDYEEVAQHLSPAVASKQREATDVRRRQNLQKFFPLKVSFLRKFSYFQIFSDIALERIIASVEPIVLHDGDFLFREGEMDSSAYFIQDGIAVHRQQSGAVSKITTGTCVGMFECSCGVNEKKRGSVVSINYCDVWRLRRDIINDVGMSEPNALLHCRKAAKRDRALEIKKEPKTPAFIKNDPYLSFTLPPVYINKLYELGKPNVFLNGERLTLIGQSVRSLAIVVNGVVDITVVFNGEQQTTRMYAGETRNSILSHEKAELNLPHGHTLVLGAYEFAASLSQYAYTATSFGLTEVLVVDRAALNTTIPPEMQTFMKNKRGIATVLTAFKSRSFAVLENEKEQGSAYLYKQDRDHQKKKKM